MKKLTTDELNEIAYRAICRYCDKSDQDYPPESDKDEAYEFVIKNWAMKGYEIASKNKWDDEARRFACDHTISLEDACAFLIQLIHDTADHMEQHSQNMLDKEL